MESAKGNQARISYMDLQPTGGGSLFPHKLHWGYIVEQLPDRLGGYKLRGADSNYRRRRQRPAQLAAEEALETGTPNFPPM